MTPNHTTRRRLRASAMAMSVLLVLGLAVIGNEFTSPVSAFASGSGARAELRLAPSNSSSANLKYYRVRDSYQGQQEFLYEIAERFLGDGNLFPAIFDLNKNRLQPDGGRLTDPTQLEAGWLLILPNDAHGAGISTGPLPCCDASSASSIAGPPQATSASVGATTPANSASSDPTSGRSSSAAPVAGQSSAAAGAASSASAHRAQSGGSSSLLSIGLTVVAIVVAAALGLLAFWWLPQRRAVHQPPDS